MSSLAEGAEYPGCSLSTEHSGAENTHPLDEIERRAKPMEVLAVIALITLVLTAFRCGYDLGKDIHSNINDKKHKK